MLALWRRLPLAVRALIVTLAALALSLAIFGCASEHDALASAGIVGGGAAAGSAVGGPIGAAIGGVAAHFWNVFNAPEGDILKLGFFGRIGHALDQFILWAVVIGVALLFVFPRWRSITLAFFLGLPRAIMAALKRDAPAAKAALADVVLAAPRILGAVRESNRTRPKPVPLKES